MQYPTPLTPADDQRSATDPLEFRRLQRTFFDHAEKKRRWNVDDSIPWEGTKTGTVSDDLVDVLEAFYATEMFLPDYSAKLIALNRQNQGMAWFLTNWCYEESKHSMAIEQWFLRSGARTEEQMNGFNQALLANEWHLPFSTSRQMITYSCIQELATQRNYLSLSRLTAPFDDKALQRTLLLIASDEGVHHKMMASCLDEYMRADRLGTIRDVAHVLANFSMPAHDAIPGWQERGKLIEKLQIYNARKFITEVMQPFLKRMQITRAELKQARAELKQAREESRVELAPAARITA